MMKKYIPLSSLALIVACGGSSPRNDEDSDPNRRDMGQRNTGDVYDPLDLSGIEPTDSVGDVKLSDNIPNDRQDLEDKIDAGNDMGREDMETPDMGMDMGDPDMPITYPIARLNCGERNDDGLCVYRARIREDICLDPSPSQAAPGRRIVSYVLTANLINPDFYTETSNIADLCFRASRSREAEGMLEIIDNEDERGSTNFYSIISE